MTAEIPATALPDFTIASNPQKPEDWSGEMIVLPMFASPKVEGEVPLATLTASAAALDEKVGGAVAELVETEDFKGGSGDSATVRLAGGSVRKVAILGLGEPEKLDYASFGAALAKIAKSEKCATMGVVMPEESPEASKVQSALQAVFNGVYSDNRFKTGTPSRTCSLPLSLRLSRIPGGCEDNSSNHDHQAHRCLRRVRVFLYCTPLLFCLGDKL